MPGTVRYSGEQVYSCLCDILRYDTVTYIPVWFGAEREVARLCYKLPWRRLTYPGVKHPVLESKNFLACVIALHSKVESAGVISSFVRSRAKPC